MLPRSRPLQIYFKPGLKEDDLMLRVWDACSKDGRPQHIFRSMLRAGLMAMVEAGDLPESVIEECGLDALVERRRRRVSRHTDRAPAAVPAYQQPAYQPIPPQPQPPFSGYYPHQPAYPSQEQAYAHPAPPPAPAAPPAAAPERGRPSSDPTREDAPRRSEVAPAAPVFPAPPPADTPAPSVSPSNAGDKPKRKLGNLM